MQFKSETFGKTQNRNRCKEEITVEKGTKNCWISTLSTDNLMFYFFINATNLKQNKHLLKRQSSVHDEK